jgi:hypothetical protein
MFRIENYKKKKNASSSITQPKVKKLDIVCPMSMWEEVEVCEKGLSELPLMC